MDDLNSLNFSNRDLRNRSFRGKNLNRANFSGSDIRGCDFSYSQLVEANFERAKAGQTIRQVLPVILLSVIFALVSANGVSRLAFAALGQTPEQSAWSSVVILHLFAGVAGIGAASRVLLGLDSKIGKVGMYLSGLCSGALTGFFYAGNYSGLNVQVAIAGAVAGAVLVAVLSWFVRKPMVVLILAMGAVAAYGFAFLIWTVAIACLNTQRYLSGFGLGALSLGSVWCVVCSLRAAGYEIRQVIGTSFQGANITNARFDGASLKNTDFSRVIGFPK